jgi:hypothetical protein
MTDADREIVGDAVNEGLTDIEGVTVLEIVWVRLTDVVADSESVRVEDDEAVIVKVADTQLDADRE